MSNAPFDAGRDQRWHALNTFDYNGSILAGERTLVSLDLSPSAIYRVDYASVVLQYEAGDGNAYAWLSVFDPLALTSGPFLSASSGVWTPATTWPLAICAQLTLPFIITRAAEIRVNGHGQFGGASVINGTVSVSYSYVN